MVHPNETGSALLISALLLLISIFSGPSSARVDLVTLPETTSVDITILLMEATGFTAVHNVIPLNVGSGPGDDYLLVDDGHSLAGLNLSSWQVDFIINRQELRELLGITGTPDVEVASINPMGRMRDPIADLLILIVDASSKYALDLGSGQGFPYTGDPILPGDYLAGIGYDATSDYGCVYRNAESPYHWNYHDLATGGDIPLELNWLLGYQPKFLQHLSLGWSREFECLLSVSENSGETPTVSPTPTPSWTPTPAGTQYPLAALVINSLGENISLVGRGIPREIQIGAVRVGYAPNRILLHEGEIYVVNSLSNSITVYDPSDGRYLRSYSVGDWANPWDLTFIDSDRFVVSCLIADKLKIFHRSSGYLGEIAMPTDLPHDPDVEQTWARPMGLTVHAGRIYAACGNLNRDWVAGGPGIVCVVNPDTRQVERWFAVPGRNTVAVVHHQGFPDLLFCVNSGDADPELHRFLGNGSIDVYSFSSDSVAYTVATGDAPVWMEIAANGLAYATNAYDSKVLIFNPVGGSLLPPIELGISGDSRYVSALRTSDTDLWILEFSTNQLFIYALSDHTLREGPYLIGDGPIDLVLLP